MSHILSKLSKKLLIREKKLTLKDSINWANDWNRRKVEYLKQELELIQTDPDEKKRKKSTLMCKCCSYKGPTMAGHAFTPYQCIACLENDNYPNTAIPKLCMKCAEELKLCHKCCGDL